ncbi:hypothetical protein [Tropicimonas sp. S265A]|uniref:hypothetical protein n=1 Tax=Tropicimonas sp. S265A TaxID=3415134 RepID=UPI003C7BAA66
MFLVKAAAVAAALFTLSATARSATVDAFNMSLFSFDIRSSGDLVVEQTAFSCSFDPICQDAAGTLAPGATLRISFGLTPGGDELGTRDFVNLRTVAINNASGNVATSPAVHLPAAADTVFAAFGFVDDVYTVNEFSIRTQAGGFSGTPVAASQAVPLVVMPLSASGILLLIGLGAFGVLGRRARRKSRQPT